MGKTGHPLSMEVYFAGTVQQINDGFSMKCIYVVQSLAVSYATY